MVAVTLADDWIHSVLSLATSPTPGGGVILMIAMFHRIVYRLQHQSDAGGKNSLKLLIWIQFPHSLCQKVLEANTEGPDGGQQGQRLTSLARREVSHRLQPGQGQRPL